MLSQVGEIIKKLRKTPERLELPGNPRYQPESLKPFFGYDNNARFYLDVEWALLKVLAKLNMLPPGVEARLTDEIHQMIRSKVNTTLEDAIEKTITKHDIRALVAASHYFLITTRRRLAKALARWFHVPATSYDIIDTARIVAYKRAFWEVSFPSLLNLIGSLKEKVLQFSGVAQIGRTHGQHAEPITVGFWLATILGRIIGIAEHLVAREAELVGKFNGPVGAYNCQVALGFERKSQEMFGKTFEELVLAELSLSPAPISTQILPPEPLDRFLFEFTLLSGALGQISRDCRNLQRTELSEVVEPFEASQDGSSAMPHKRNPISWEGIEGIYTIVKNEFHKVLDVVISDHQRDATGMCVMREFPGIIVLTQHQLETANRIVPRISVDTEALNRNFAIDRHLVLSEAVYIALVMAGYQGDAHSLVNHTLVPRSQVSGRHLITELSLLADEKPRLKPVLANIPSELINWLQEPEDFIGLAKEKALEIAYRADAFLAKYDQGKEV
jgi:adenylosuccinate lyase